MHIIIYSPIRTGSTLIFNVVRSIDNNFTIDKTHGPIRSLEKLGRGLQNSDKCIFTFRNPYDSIVSLFQCHKKEKTKENLDKFITEFNWSLMCLKHYKNNNFLWLKYENFKNNYQYIFDKIENYLDIKINKNKKLEIIEEFSISGVKEKIKNYKNFWDFDKKTELHGNHISNDNGKINKWKTFFTESEKNYIYKELCKKTPKFKIFMENEYPN